MKTITGFLLAGSLMFGALSATGAEELALQANYAQNHVVMTQFLVPDADKIAAASNGELKINIYGIGAVVPPNETVPGVQNNMVDMVAGLVTNNVAALYPITGQLATMPGLGTSSVHAAKIYQKMYEEIPEVKAELDSVGKILAIWSTPMTAISSVKCAIRSPKDLQGKKVLFFAPGDKQTIEAWGGVPVQVNASDIYTGLQRGMGEAFLCPMPMQRGQGLQDVAKFLTIFPASNSLTCLVMNKDVFESLPAEQQKLITNTFNGNEYGLRVAAALDQDVKNAAKLFEDNGCQLIEPESLNAFSAPLRTEQLIESYWIPALKKNNLKGDIREWIDRIYAFAATVPAE